jgi:hypothetical protein
MGIQLSFNNIIEDFKDTVLDRKKIVLVYYIGGITYAEISAFRYLSTVYTGI